ncbi:MAG: hypothetical protein ACYDIC_01100 [Desulfobaccales bacterium]
MKLLKILLLGIIITVCFDKMAIAGVWATNNFLYEPSYGESGTTSYNNYTTGLTRVDTRLGNEIWVGDPNYGSTLSAAVTAIGTNQTTLHLSRGTYNLTSNLTIPANVTLKPEQGAIISIGSAGRITINGRFEAGLYQVFSISGTGRVVFGSGAIKEVFPQWFYSGTGSWASAFQAAVNSLNTGNVISVSGSYDLGSTAITWKEGVNLLGGGLGRTNITSSATGYAILWTTANGTTERKGPRFADFTLTANSGIKLNDPANGFIDASGSQEYILRPTIERVKLIAATPNSGIGFQGSKCFSLKIIDSEFFRFSTNIELHACDDSEITHNRILGGNQGVRTNANGGIYKYNTFGNSQVIKHNQFNMLNVGAANNFIETGAQAITIKDNYFEQGDTINSIVKVLDGTYTFRFLNNHVGVSAEYTTYVLDFTGMGNFPQNVEVAGNYGYANLMDPIGLPTAGVGYYYNDTFPRHIYHAGNDSQLDNGYYWPFNSDWSGRYTGNEAAVFTPSHIGLRTVGCYNSVKCFRNRFRLPALTSSDFIQFSPGATGQVITGTVTIKVLARSDTPGQQFNMSYANSGATIDTQTKTLTNANQDYWLTVWSSIAANDISINVWNEDTIHNGNIDISRIVILYD